MRIIDIIADLIQADTRFPSGATGIGKQTVKQLLRHNAKVYVASRSKGKFEQLFNHLKSADPHMTAGLNFLELDLSDATSCISAAKHFTKLEGRLDVLIANAALAVVVSYLLWARSSA